MTLQRPSDCSTLPGIRASPSNAWPDAPVVGVRESVGWHDEIYLAGFSDSCTAIRRRRSSLIVPGGLPVAERVNGDALTVLHTVVRDWTT
jgi:hypothetical protein